MLPTRTAGANDRVIRALFDTMRNPVERRAWARNRGTALATQILPMQYLLKRVPCTTRPSGIHGLMCKSV